MALSSFGIKGFSRHSSLEQGGLWTGRLSIQGVRVVCIARTSEMKDFMAAHGMLGMDPKSFFRDIQNDTLLKLMQSIKVFHSTIGVGDFLWTPSHTVVLESVMKEDVYGLRVGMVTPRDLKGFNVFKMKAEAASTPENDVSKILVAAVAKVAVAAAS